MNERFEDTQERVLVLSKNAKGSLAASSEDSFYACYTEAVDDVLSQAEGHLLLNIEINEALQRRL